MSATRPRSGESPGRDAASPFRHTPAPEAVAWAAKTLLGAPALLAALFLSGVLLAVIDPGQTGDPVLWAVTVAGAVLQLAVASITYRYGAAQLDAVGDEGRQLLRRGVRRIPRLFLVTLVVVGAMLVVALLLALLVNPIGALVIGVPVVLLYLVHTSLAVPAVALGRPVTLGLADAWVLAREARLTLLGILLLVAVPLAIADWLLSGTAGPPRLLVGGVYGVLLGVDYLAFTRCYVELR